jgi:hypothetical protein
MTPEEAGIPHFTISIQMNYRIAEFALDGDGWPIASTWRTLINCRVENIG